MEPAAAQTRRGEAGVASFVRSSLAALPGRVTILLAVALLDGLFLHAIWRPLGNLGIWDWDYQMTLVEAARKTLLEYHELPLWNRWLGGGSTLVGHPLARTFDPLFLPPLLFGTVGGLKLAILVYLWIGQVGVYRLARVWGARWEGAALAALVFSWSGAYAQHLTHGHVEWMAYAWVPWLFAALERGFGAPRLRSLLAPSVFLSLAWLDGGPYQYAFVPLMAFVYALAGSLQRRSAWPLALVAVAVVVAAALAAVQLAPVIDTVLELPRQTEAVTRYYQGRFPVGAGGALWQAFLSRAQTHDPAVYMPFRVNVGAYVGLVPLALAGVALATGLRRVWPLGLCLAFAMLLFLSSHLPFSPWQLLHRLPGFAGLRVPARFNFFAVLWLAGLAGLGLDRLLAARSAPGWRRGVAAAVLGFVALDLFTVCSPIFGHAFVVPPFPVKEASHFRQYANSPYRGRYAERATRPVWNDQWPNETFPVVCADEGTIRAYPGLLFMRSAIPFDHPEYPGSEVSGLGEARVLDFALTPNTVTATVDAPGGQGGRIVVNQNYQRWWRIVGGDVGRVSSFRGRLAVEVPPGRHVVRLAYRPTPFFVGAGVSVGAWLTVLGLAVRGRAVRRAEA